MNIHKENTYKENTTNDFCLQKYFKEVEKIIKKIFERNQKINISYDILETEKSRRNSLTVLKEKQRQMKIGEIWQEVIGNYKDFENLKQGHQSGLDVISHKRKIAIEIKNRTNTDNSSSKKANLSKLARFKKENPDYLCIYATINDSSREKTFFSYSKTIIHDEQEIKHYTGTDFLKLIFEDNMHIIIDFLKTAIDKFS